MLRGEEASVRPTTPTLPPPPQTCNRNVSANAPTAGALPGAFPSAMRPRRTSALTLSPPPVHPPPRGRPPVHSRRARDGRDRHVVRAVLRQGGRVGGSAARRGRWGGGQSTTRHGAGRPGYRLRAAVRGGEGACAHATRARRHPRAHPSASRRRQRRRPRRLQGWGSGGKREARAAANRAGRTDRDDPTMITRVMDEINAPATRWPSVRLDPFEWSTRSAATAAVIGSSNTADGPAGTAAGATPRACTCASGGSSPCPPPPPPQMTAARGVALPEVSAVLAAPPRRGCRERHGRGGRHRGGAPARHRLRGRVRVRLGRRAAGPGGRSAGGGRGGRVGGGRRRRRPG